jgi:hypothetical protein
LIIKNKDIKITAIAKKYNTQAKCLNYLEKLRWGKVVKCPYCASRNNKRYKSQKNRHKCNTFEKYLINALSNDKSTKNWKISTPKKVKELVYNNPKNNKSCVVN